MTEQGYFYVAWGRRQFLDEAITSVRSLKRVSPGAHATIAFAGDVPDDIDLHAEFDAVIEATSPPTDSQNSTQSVGMTFKVQTIRDHAPYPRTCYVDTDTYFIDPIDALFDLLDHFPLALAQSPGDRDPARVPATNEPLRAFTPYNAGLMVFDRAGVEELFSVWGRLTEQWLAEPKPDGVHVNDQRTMVSALLEVPVRFAVLQPIWNARLPFPERFAGRVHLIHARPSEMGGLSLAEAARRINRTTAVRIWLPGVNDVYAPREGHRGWLRISARGLWPTLRHDLDRVRRRIRRLRS